MLMWKLQLDNKTRIIQVKKIAAITADKLNAF